MFFPEKIKSILPTDRVLEIGPGADPHPRSDTFLEKTFSTEEAFNQRGRVESIALSKQVVYYDGDKFPFADGEFDYVICSHVLEHVADPAAFVSEVCRVAKKGYFEFPMPHYEYLLNIPEHISFVFYDGQKLKFKKKSDSSLEEFAPIQAFFRLALEKGYHFHIDQLKHSLIQGFEWEGDLNCIEVKDISNLLAPLSQLVSFSESEWSRSFMILHRDEYRNLVEFRQKYASLAEFLQNGLRRSRLVKKMIRFFGGMPTE